MDADPITELSQSLNAAGVHPSQTDPVVIPERGDIFPHVRMPEPPPRVGRFTSNEKAMGEYREWLATQKEGWWLHLRLRFGLIPDFWWHLR